jgi:hypothetical protein
VSAGLLAAYTVILVTGGPATGAPVEFFPVYTEQVVLPPTLFACARDVRDPNSLKSLRFACVYCSKCI